MSWKATKTMMASLCVFGAASSVTAQSTNPTPTCSDVLDIDVHGQHVVADYVIGDHDYSEWPPSDGTIGEEIGGNGGAALPGGPGPGFHFPNEVAPGASFCTDSRSPGVHL